MIQVTKPFLPPQEKLNDIIGQIYERNHLTNNGPLVQELEARLKEYLNVKNVLLVTNGTLALQVAFKLLGLKGKVITTPFSFIATTSSLLWENLTPVFSDIGKSHFNIDHNLIEDSITNDTSAILPVHVFGNPCEVNNIQSIADKHNLKIIYDASHAFNIKLNDNNILNFGDISTLSFHATKIFHTIEGGALIINDDDLYEKAKSMINFGFKNGEIHSLGINAKMNEFSAAMGLLHLDYIDEIISERKEISKYYMSELNDFVKFQEMIPNTEYNFSYFPIILDNLEQLNSVREKLNSHNIFPRRYFNPSLDQLPFVKNTSNCPNSIWLADRILCLPLYPGLQKDDQRKIVSLIKEAL